MEVTVHLNLTSEQIFDYIVDGVVSDIERVSNKKVSQDALVDGYTYEKKLNTKNGKETKVTVEINQIAKPTIYQASIYGPLGLNTISYEFTKLENNQAKVTYKESFKSKSTFGNLNYMLVSLLYRGKSKKYMKEMLLNIEQQILSKNEVEGV